MGGTYIDGSAGAGRANVTGHGEVPGSVELAIRAATFRRLLVYEFDETVAAELDHNLSLRFGPRTLMTVWRRPGVDFNDAVLADVEQGKVDRERSCFAFLDPNSTQLGWQTVEALAAYTRAASRQRTARLNCSSFSTPAKPSFASHLESKDLSIPTARWRRLSTGCHGRPSSLAGPKRAPLQRGATDVPLLPGPACRRPRRRRSSSLAAGPTHAMNRSQSCHLAQEAAVVSSRV